MGERTSVYFDDETWPKLEAMAHGDLRTVSNFLNKLTREEWDRRHPVEIVRVEELPHPVGAEPVPLVFVKRPGDEDEVGIEA
jgi:hypothetical protein